MENDSFIFDARHLVSEPVGEKQTEALADQADIDGSCAQVNGEASLTNIDDGILAEIAFTATLPLECARCLKQYQQTLRVETSEVFADNPGLDQFKISPTFQVDLAEPIRQAVILNIPGFPLCQTDCKGILEETS